MHRIAYPMDLQALNMWSLGVLTGSTCTVIYVHIHNHMRPGAALPMLFSRTLLICRCIPILMYASHCISDGLAGSQHEANGCPVGFDVYCNLCAYTQPHAPWRRLAHTLQSHTVDLPLYFHLDVCITLHIRWSCRLSTCGNWVSCRVRRVL